MQEKHAREVSVQEQYLDEHGHELPNPTPMQPPVGYVKHKSIAEQIREAIRQASLEAAQAGAETEEEANDFDVGEDMEPSSPWESDFEPDPALEHMIALQSRAPAQPTEGAQTPSSASVPPLSAQPPSSTPSSAVVPSSGPA